MKVFLLAIVAMLIVTSCTIEHTVDFNENMSGSNKVTLDISEMVSTLGTLIPDSSEKTTQTLLGSVDKEILDLKKEIESIEGLSNFKTINNAKENIFGFQFDFKDIKFISAGMDAANKEKSNFEQATTLFTLYKNKLIVDFGSTDIADIMKGEEDEEGLMGFDMGNYVFTINFPFKIKSIDNDAYLISEDRKSVSINILIEEVSKNSKQMNAEIVW